MSESTESPRPKSATERCLWISGLLAAWILDEACGWLSFGDDLPSTPRSQRLTLAALGAFFAVCAVLAGEPGDALVVLEIAAVLLVLMELVRLLHRGLVSLRNRVKS